MAKKYTFDFKKQVCSPKVKTSETTTPNSFYTPTQKAYFPPKPFPKTGQ